MPRASTLLDRRSLVLAFAGVSATTLGAITLAPAFRQAADDPAPLGHPSSTTPTPDTPLRPAPTPSAVGLESATRGGSGLPPNFEIPPLSPLATGRYVNFEPPPVKPIALSFDGRTLFVANTPNDSLAVIDTQGDALPREIPIGIGPVAVAVQPGTSDNLVWVSNFISDNVSVVDAAAGKVVAVIAVGDEPAAIAFDDAGAFAFAIIHGVAHTSDGTVAPVVPNVREGHLLVIDTQSRQVVSRTHLECNTPEDLVYDPATQRIHVTAFHSGNNTTVVGHPVLFNFVFPPPDPPPAVPPPVDLNELCDDGNPACAFFFPHLWAAQNFSQTRDIFANTPELAPWPDNVATNGPEPAPLVHRIIRDATAPVAENGWAAIIEVLSNNGLPDPAMVALMNQELGITNAASVIAAMIDDAKDSDDRDLITLDASNPSSSDGLPIVAALPNVGTTLTGLARNPATGQLLVTNLQALNHKRPLTNINGRFMDHEVVIVGDPLDPATIQSRDLHFGVQNFSHIDGPNPVAWQRALANPQDIVVHDNGLTAYVAANGSSRIGVINAVTGRVLGRVDVADGPTGLALDSANNLLYVMSRVENCVTVVNVSDSANPQVVASQCLFNPEPPEIQYGRQFLYSSLFSNNGASSCSACHPGGRLDHLAWDLGDPHGELEPAPPNVPGENHPLKGPMVTLSLQGLKDHEHFHWRGDRPTFQDFNPAFEKLLGGTQLSPADMDGYTAFIMSIAYPPSPFYNRNNSLKDPRGLDGIDEYFQFCNGCHQVDHDAALFFNSNGDGGMFLNGGMLFAQIQEVTQLRGLHKKFNSDLYNGFGLIHDGREEREDNDHPLQTFIKQFFPEAQTGIDAEDQLDLITFITSLPTNAMTVIGWQILVEGGSGSPALLPVDLATMIAQHDKTPSACDVVAKGLVGGESRSYYLITGGTSPTFQSDRDELIVLSDLVASMEAADSLVFTAWPPESGPRAIDQDGDCLSDGLDAAPQQDNFADPNFDGAVNLAEVASLQACFTGEGASAGPDCQLLDRDCDGDVDLIDYTAFHAALSDE